MGGLKMDRQTIRYPDGAVELKCSANDAVMRLAAYEDTGLTPEEISELLDRNEITPQQECFINEKADSIIAGLKELLAEVDEQNHATELLQAESEGRLIVLPCKVGDTVFEITNLPGDDAIQMRFVAEIAWLSGHGTVLLSSGLVIGLDEFGKTIFPTREEAEAALGGGSI